MSIRASRAEPVITPYRDGPLLVRGPVRLLDAAGVELEHRRQPVALCRCGKSRLRPFCDGTHKLVGFRAPGVPELAGRDGVSAVEDDDCFTGVKGVRFEVREQ